MRNFLCLLMCICLLQVSQGQIDYKYKNNETFTYDETTKIYQKLQERFPLTTKFEEVGTSDIGRPIYLFTISADGDFNPQTVHQKGKTVLLINNAIHPGEPCGVDASVKLAEDLLTQAKYKETLKNVVVCIIPFYNVGGGLNRSCCSRANQNGPKAYGFRGNSQNRDLNRDFIKADTKNARAFIKAYQQWQPDVFMDTHTTNGSDFQYVMTLIATQPDKLQPELAKPLREELVPFLYKDMKRKKMEMIPYVYMVKRTPEDGIKDYLETPRYSTGYTTLFNTLGFVSEALKYKPYEARVENTYELLLSTLNWMSDHKKELKNYRKAAQQSVIEQDSFDLAWTLDTTEYEMIDFKGYEREYVPSDFGEDQKRLIYNNDKPITHKIRYYNRYKPSVTVKKPAGYIIPQAYDEVIERLKLNNIKMERLKNDTTIAVDMYFIEEYQTVKNPYEGHYIHYGVKVRKEYMPVKFYKGDYVAYANQSGNRYLIETLEPQGSDSFFAWNFFDGILQQKEWFSPFSFEPLAKQLLEDDQYLREAFEAKKKEDPEFAKKHYDQLYFIYTHSPYYENTHNRYPVARMVD